MATILTLGWVATGWVGMRKVGVKPDRLVKGWGGLGWGGVRVEGGVGLLHHLGSGWWRGVCYDGRLG